MKKNRDVFEVTSNQCDECLFSDRKIVSDARKANIIEKVHSHGGYFACHQAQLSGQDLCCRGFFENENTAVTGLAKALDLVRFVKIKAKGKR